MTSISIQASRTRAGMLVLALALVGGTGCITTAIVQDVQQKNRMREAEQARQRRIAELSPRAATADPVAERELGEALLSASEPALNDLPRALDLLSQAAAQGDGRAQALLGDMLVSGSTQFSTHIALPLNLRDRARGIALLQRAATQACRSKEPGQGLGYHGHVNLAYRVGAYLEADRRIEESSLWRARSVLHCGFPDAVNLAYRAENERSPQGQAQWLALLMLTKSSKPVDATKTRMSVETIAAAEREAAELRRQVAQSEQQYPAPSRKDM